MRRFMLVSLTGLALAGRWRRARRPPMEPAGVASNG